MRFRYIRIFFSDFVLLPVFIFCLLNADLVTYGLRMGKGQMDIVLGARDFEEVYADSSVSIEVKERLRFIEEVREFAFDSIGLARNDNYTTFYDQKGQRLLYVVTASKPFELKAHLWSFPVLGDVPYKGFFKEEKADAESARLKAEGWDVDIGGASGWSTLGWFQDPVLSGMLKMSEGELAELIIHELTHGTIFVKDNVDYNENLAQFVGMEGAKWFLAARYGESSDELDAYINGNRDGDLRTRFMLHEAKYLDSVYRSFSPVLSDADKQAAKRRAFAAIVVHADSLKLEADTTFSRRLAGRLEKSGNTVFMQYLRYEGKKDDFTNEFMLVNKDLREFVRRMHEKYPE